MSDKHATLQAFGIIFASWCGVFFGVWALPLSDQLKIILDFISTTAFIGFGLSYFLYKGIIPVSMFAKITFWLSLIAISLQAIVSFYIGAITWEVVVINEVAVVTYTNVVSFYFLVMGFVSIIFALITILKRNPYKKSSDNEN